MQKIEETSFLKKVIISMRDFERYPELAAQKGIHVFFYIVKLILIISIIIGAVITYQYYTQIQEGIQYFKEQIPDFTYEEGALSVNAETPIFIKNEKSDIMQQVIIDTTDNVSEETLKSYKTKIGDSQTAIIVLKDKIWIKALTLAEYNYKDIFKVEEITKFDKEEVINVYLTGQNEIILYMGLFLVVAMQFFVLNLINTILYAMVIGLLSYTTAILLRIRLKLSATFKMAIHAFTLPTLLYLIYSVINAFTGFQIMYFEIMYVGVAYIYMIASILMIKSDIIKRKEELEKIVEEQTKIAQEEEERKKEEEKKKEKEEKEPEEKKKEEKPKKKKKELGDVAGGPAVIGKERKTQNE